MNLNVSSSVSTMSVDKFRSRVSTNFDTPSPINRVKHIKAHKENILNKLKKRKRNVKTEVTPALASAVIRKFIMPIFNEEMQHHQSRSRSTLFNSRPADSLQAPVKLSSYIEDLLESTLTVLSTLKEKLRKTLDLTDKGYQELNSMKNKFSDIQSLISTMNCSLMSYKICAKKERIMTPFKHYEKLDLERKYKVELEVRANILNTIDRLSASSNKLKGLNQMEYHNQWMLLMDSAIVGERLKGYYFATFNICQPENLEFRLKQVQNRCDENCRQMISEETEKLIYVRRELPKVIDLLAGSTTSFIRGNSLRAEIKKMKIAIISSVQNLDQSIFNTEIEANLLQKSKTHMGRKFMNFTEEYQKMKYKLEKITDNNLKTNEKVQDKVCGTCSKIYNELENFNWSCRTHISTWNGKMYWCCGKTHKLSFGCKIQKHRCKEGVLAIEDKDSDFSIAFCLTCKKQGHLAKECELDPNITIPSPDKSVKTSKLTSNKVLEVFKKKQKKFKIVKNNKSVNQLIESMHKPRPIRAKRDKVVRGLIDKSAPTTPTVSGSNPLIEHFPLISRRRMSLK